MLFCSNWFLVLDGSVVLASSDLPVCKSREAVECDTQDYRPEPEAYMEHRALEVLGVCGVQVEQEVLAERQYCADEGDERQELSSASPAVPSVCLVAGIITPHVQHALHGNLSLRNDTTVSTLLLCIKKLNMSSFM